MNYKAYFSLEGQLKQLGFVVDRKDFILSFTGGRTDSLKELSNEEYGRFIHWISERFDFSSKDWQQTPENRMRRKIYALFVYQMGYSKERLEQWCVKYGKYNKPLNLHSYQELVVLVTQAENVYQSFIKSISGS